VLILAGPTGEGEHVGAEFHPERPARIGAVMAGVADLHLGDDLVAVPAPLAPQADLARVHLPSYLEALEAFCLDGGGDLDPDTFAGVDSWAAARRAAGAGLAAIAALREHDDGVAFVAGRPPGHHAEADRAMGFCLLNNVAVAAASLTAVGERVLIVDWDVHHGNGTQAIFDEDPTVFYFSVHQSPFYPGTGSAGDKGVGKGLGSKMSVPLPAGSGDAEYKKAFEERLKPAAAAFKPDFVLISAGFDAANGDLLGGMKVTPQGYAELTRIVQGIAEASCSGRLVSMLEGGYNTEALAASVEAHVRVLMGSAAP